MVEIENLHSDFNWKLLVSKKPHNYSISHYKPINHKRNCDDSCCHVTLGGTDDKVLCTMLEKKM